MWSCSYCRFFFFSSRRRHTRCSRDWSSDVCSSDLTQVTLDPGLELDPALSPDRRFIAYVAGRPGRTNLFVRQVDGGLPIRVVTDQGEQRFPTWSPDGERLLFASTRGIEIVPALGGVPRVLIAGVGAGADSRLRPGPIARDGRAFVFASSDSVFVKPLDGGEAPLVTAAWEA